VVETAPPTFVNELPPLVETCHWTVGVGDPDAEALNDAGDPEATDSLVGEDVMEGALVDTVVVTVNVAAAVVAWPTEFVNTAWYWYPFSEDVAEKE